jgi:4-diphosphocytidyl-2-C-methyl-D-erythritol kinase
VKIRAPAKINLGLRIVGKRQDGYHLLDTIMVPVSLYDEIHITRAKAKQIKEGRDGRQCLSVVCSDSSVPSGRGNLVYRAAELIMSRSQVRAAIDIRVEKNIPVGAGLGGGSSDAAATLIGLNRFLELGYSVEQLKEFGKALGADVPFFVGGTPARARGIGERLSPLGALPRIWAVIVYPGFPVTTAWVYRNFQATLTKPIANTSISSLLKKPFGQMRLLVNDLETVTLVRYPRIGLLKQKLVEEGAAGALMSGSGSAVFGLFDSRGKAARAFSRLQKEEGVETFLVRLLSS